MLNKLSLTLALAFGALLSTQAGAASVSLDYSGTLDDGSSFSTSVSWDPAAAGTPRGPSTYGFGLTSFTLSVGGVDYTSHLVSPIAMISQSVNNQDLLLFDAGISGIASGALAGASSVTLSLYDHQGRMFSDIASLPGDTSFTQFSENTILAIAINGDSPDGTSLSAAFLVPASPVSAVPEPESYALFLAGLGVVGAMARRRRSADVR